MKEQIDKEQQERDIDNNGGEDTNIEDRLDDTQIDSVPPSVDY